MGFKEWIKDLFGIEDKKPELSDEQLQPYYDGEKQMTDELDRMDREYREKERAQYESMVDILPEDPGYEYRKYEGDPLEEMLRRVRESYQNQYDAKSSQLQGKYEEDSAALKQKEQQAWQKAVEEMLENQVKHAEATDEMKKKTTDAGMGRSSVPKSLGKELDQARESADAQAKQTVSNTVQTLQTQLQQLQQERDRALKELDLEQASELQTQVDKTRKQYQDELQKIEAYNQSVREKELEYAKDREQAIEKQIQERDEFYRKQAEREREEGYWGEKAADYNKRVQLAYDYYSKLPADVSVALIKRNTRLKTYLGHDYGKLLGMLSGN